VASGIYEIVNTVNGKRYVGSSVNMQERWLTHLRELRKGTHHAQHLQRSFSKYGEDKFILVILRYCERDELIEYEQDELDSGYDYNSSPTAQSTLGLKFSPEARERVRQNRLKRMKDDPEGYSALMSSLSKGKPKSDEWKEKMRLRHTGVPKPKSQVENMARGRAVFSEDKIREVRRRCDSGQSKKSVASDLGMVPTTVQRIANRERYKWVI